MIDLSIGGLIGLYGFVFVLIMGGLWEGYKNNQGGRAES